MDFQENYRNLSDLDREYLAADREFERFCEDESARVDPITFLEYLREDYPERDEEKALKYYDKQTLIEYFIELYDEVQTLKKAK